ncbi:hypothetical protein C8Q77DRAFT_249554 [Trametes polyzona]|nr:hypothetical protein C8Q77DRAFT_249554 [Trametes polyzona]
MTYFRVLSRSEDHASHLPLITALRFLFSPRCPRFPHKAASYTPHRRRSAASVSSARFIAAQSLLLAPSHSVSPLSIPLSIYLHCSPTRRMAAFSHCTCIATTVSSWTGRILPPRAELCFHYRHPLPFPSPSHQHAYIPHCTLSDPVACSLAQNFLLTTHYLSLYPWFLSPSPRLSHPPLHPGYNAVLSFSLWSTRCPVTNIATNHPKFRHAVCFRRHTGRGRTEPVRCVWYLTRCGVLPECRVRLFLYTVHPRLGTAS